MACLPPSPPGQEVEAGLVNATNASGIPPRPEGPSSGPPPLHLRTCVLCRQRKVKCDRKQPCSNCARTEASCVYPPGPGRAAKKPRNPVDTQLFDRLSKLEGIIKRLQSQNQSRDRSHAASGPSAEEADGLSQATAEPCIPMRKEEEPGPSPDSLATHNLGRLMIDETKSYYIGNILWAELGNEIEELRDMLHESPSEDEEDQVHSATPLSSFEDGSPSRTLESNAVILGYRSLAHSLRSFHPPLQESVTLFAGFNENVLPMAYVFHMPTTTRVYWDAVAALESSSAAPLDKDTEALLFAIYYSAATSLDAEPAALARYRFATEQALARASLLTTQSITVLQAAVLFLTALRHEDETRTVWSLTALVFHIAQAMGLHRDGAAFSLRPLETELRRRLWYTICVLDTRSSDYHGYEPIVRESGFDTRLPLNVRDTDLAPEMREFPPERDGEFTEMTFGRIRGEIMRVGWKLSYVSPSGTPGAQTDGLSLRQREVVIEDLRKTLDDKYLRHFDTTVPFQSLTCMVTRVVIARMWLVVHFPLGRRGEDASTTSPTPNTLDTSMRDKLFSTAVEILEITSAVLSNSDYSRWAWHSRTYIQWQAVALVLSEICLRPPSPECERAWEYVNILHNSLTPKNKGKKGTLWRPIERLMAKARHVREVQKANPSGHDHSRMLVDQSSPSYLLEQEFSGTELPLISSHPAGEYQGSGSSANTLQGMLGTGSLDAFLEAFPDNMQDELFDTMLGYS
ncbi:fungal-specific transcription factor domain-containing protein [Biscogniauxia marginata]|nr:fungal-specific transcription factor domain-containing protein [Biscogniauxia marginata]